MDKEFRDFCKKAFEVWGEEAQLRMCIEEMSELTKELCKYIRISKDEGVEHLSQKLEDTRKNILEETADVLNMVEQLALMYGEEDVAKIRKEKLERTKRYFKD